MSKLFPHHRQVEPDIRPPSPPPIYDRQGNRLNTREIRIRKAMLAEYNRLIRYMLKYVEGYVPPDGWKPQRLVKKIIIPYEKYPNASFMGVIIGARGVNHKRLQEASGCRIFIRGKDIGDKWQTDEEIHMPQHVHIEGETEEQIQVATDLVMPLLNPESPEFEYARTHGMQQLALVTGFTLKKSEQRCGVCGAIGHLGRDHENPRAKLSARGELRPESSAGSCAGHIWWVSWLAEWQQSMDGCNKIFVHAPSPTLVSSDVVRASRGFWTGLFDEPVEQRNRMPAHHRHNLPHVTYISGISSPCRMTRAKAQI
ncbi:unnamed protein product [Effrenium voratum]|uniref:Branchpoint-bridging protein n=1 Tax=Effrenium voratum TaxID=2562239 RepID=A0AA36I035_9DINO|nr:unnamed protein product [Effrenium voratum]